MSSDVPAPVDRPETTGAVGALLALAVGVGIAALVDFGGIAGPGFRAGQLILALSPWVLAIQGWSRPPGTHSLEGVVPVGWTLLLAGALGSLVPDGGEPPLGLAASAVQAVGAAAVLVLLQRSRRIGAFGLVLRLTIGSLIGAGLVAAAVLLPLGPIVAAVIANVFLTAYLVPQLVHDLLVALWAVRTKAWARARTTLEGLGMPFILWTLAGHLIIAPGILYWSPKREVVLGGLGAAVPIALLGVRGVAGLYSRREALILVLVASLYGIGLAILVAQGRRPY